MTWLKVLLKVSTKKSRNDCHRSFNTFAALSRFPSARYVWPMLKRFLPEVIKVCDESVLPSNAIKFIRASWKFPFSIRVTPSCQVFKISTMDMSAILNPSEFTLVEKEIFQGSRQSEKRKLFKRTSREWKTRLIYMRNWPGKCKNGPRVPILEFSLWWCAIPLK